MFNENITTLNNEKEKLLNHCFNLLNKLNRGTSDFLSQTLLCFFLNPEENKQALFKGKNMVKNLAF